MSVCNVSGTKCSSGCWSTGKASVSYPNGSSHSGNRDHQSNSISSNGTTGAMVHVNAKASTTLTTFLFHENVIIYPSSTSRSRGSYVTEPSYTKSGGPIFHKNAPINLKSIESLNKMKKFQGGIEFWLIPSPKTWNLVSANVRTLEIINTVDQTFTTLSVLAKSDPHTGNFVSAPITYGAIVDDSIYNWCGDFYNPHNPCGIPIFDDAWFTCVHRECTK